MPVFSLMLFLLMSMFLLAMLQIHVFEIAFSKLGLTPEATLALLIGTLLGSGINLPIFKIKIRDDAHWVRLPGRRPVWELLQPAREGSTVIAVNLGGCVIPLGLCIYFVSLRLMEPLLLSLSIALIAGLSYRLSRPIPGIGIAMPLFIAPLAAAFLALLVDPEHAAHFAYVSGVLGVLIGADILHLKSVGSLGVPVASIGGAGTFDGIFLTGLLAALLA